MTATIMETYDAQMLDYQNDLDVQMNVSSSDPWFQEMTPMEDDAHLAFQPKGTITDATPTIEVDMEAYVEDEHIEYEMTDEHHGHGPTAGELLDVDLLDASAVQSPFVKVTPLPRTPPVEYSQPPLTTPLPSALDLSVPTPTSSSLEQTSNSSEVVDPAPGNASAASVTQADDAIPVTAQLSDAATIPEPEPVPRSDDDAQHPTVPAEAPLEHSDTAQQSPAIEQPAADARQGTEGNVDNSTTLVDNEDQSESRHPDSVQESNRPGPVTDTATFTPQGDSTDLQVHAEHTDEQASTGAAQELHTNDADILKERDSLTRSAPLVDSTTEAIERAISQGGTHHGAGLNDEPIEIPNEVSEEIYLEAPPPILLSIFSTDRPELCLFNKPSEPLSSEDDGQECHILLQQVPNLYYEPLTHAFEVLRQDEYVSTVLEITGNELALEAYDLDLAITEVCFFYLYCHSL